MRPQCLNDFFDLYRTEYSYELYVRMNECIRTPLLHKASIEKILMGDVPVICVHCNVSPQSLKCTPPAAAVS